MRRRLAALVFAFGLSIGLWALLIGMLVHWGVFLKVVGLALVALLATALTGMAATYFDDHFPPEV
jgi:hypothetical protein